MGHTKFANIRYQALDQCFRNTGRRYFIEDLLQFCNNHIQSFKGAEKGVKIRQIYDDIAYMESPQGYDIKLQRNRDGKRMFYHYIDSNFSINNQPLNPVEAAQFSEAIFTLNRFKGMPQFGWMGDILDRLQTTFQLNTQVENVVQFEQLELIGIHYFTQLFNAIIHKQVLEITYKPFNKPTKTQIIHPYYLKQYNNRWFLFGQDENYSELTNLALDRIVLITEKSNVFIVNSKVNFDEYFEDFIGVSVIQNRPVEKIILLVDKDKIDYLINKPLHGSQIIRKTKVEQYTVLELRLVINYELITLLFSMSDSIKIQEPEKLKKIIQDRLQKALNNNL